MVSVQDSVIHALGMLIDFLESVKKHSPAARDFLRFPKVSQHHQCMDDAILHGKPFGIPLISYGKIALNCIKVMLCSQSTFGRVLNGYPEHN